MCELSPVSFHGDTIFCVEFDGQPFAPMRPIVENIGLDWSAQYRKLNENKDRWGVAIIATPSEGGEQETICMPVRKLPAWLASINPKKVKPGLRAKIELYQNECDDALWDYWVKGRAVRPEQPSLSADQKKLDEYIETSIQTNLAAIQEYAAQAIDGIVGEAIGKLQDIRARLKARPAQKKPTLSIRLDEKQRRFGRFVAANQDFFSEPRTAQIVGHGFEARCSNSAFGMWLRKQGFQLSRSKGYPSLFMVCLDTWKGLSGYDDLWPDWESGN